jgi:hypothetical protein
MIVSFEWRNQMAMDEKEIGNLIGSDKVEGTAVYGADDSKIGSIERVMIDKTSGRGILRHTWLRRDPRLEKRSLSAAMAIAEIRH